MFAVLLLTLCVSLFLSTVTSECANACNGHGRCTSYDMCICNRNWQSADCSERTCQFGLAHVDTSKVYFKIHLVYFFFISFLKK